MEHSYRGTGPAPAEDLIGDAATREAVKGARDSSAGEAGAAETGERGVGDRVTGADEAVAGEELGVPRRGRTAFAVSLVVAVLAVALVWVLATRQPGTDRRAASPLIDQVAPALGGGTLDGGSFDLDHHRGRWVVVNFFATWCGPCRREHPELIAFDEAHRATGDARVVSVLYDESPRDAREFFARNGGDWPVLPDEDGRFGLNWGVVGVPETYLVAPNGRVAAKLIGGVTQEGIDGIIADRESGGSDIEGP